MISWLRHWTKPESGTCMEGNTMAPKEVLIIGGGIAGMQAALDLGDMGIQVHLVEKNPSIGGKMAQLDKTFPTNDCTI